MIKRDKVWSEIGYIDKYIDTYDRCRVDRFIKEISVTCYI
jgi:hypothetical protein